MLADLKTRLTDLERVAQAAEGRDDDLAGMVAGLNRAFGALCRVLEEERPGTVARLLAALDEAEGDAVEGYRERVTETMRSMLACIEKFLLGIGKFTSPRIASGEGGRVWRNGRDISSGCRRLSPVGRNRNAEQ